MNIKEQKPLEIFTGEVRVLDQIWAFGRYRDIKPIGVVLIIRPKIGCTTI